MAAIITAIIIGIVVILAVSTYMTRSAKNGCSGRCASCKMKCNVSLINCNKDKKE